MTTTTGEVPRAPARLAALLFTGMLAACGGDGGNDTTITYNNHLPLQVDDRWVYRERDTSGQFGTMTSISTETVVERHLIDGTPYYRVLPNGGVDIISSMYAASASGIQRRSPYSVSPSPSFDLVRFPTFEGASFIQDDGPYDMGADQDFDGKPDPFSTRITTSTVGVETLSTPAGDFSGALHMREQWVTTTRLSSSGTDATVTGTHDTWYAPGVGRVRWETRYDDYVVVGELMRHVPASRPDPDTTPPVVVRVEPPSGAGAPLVLTFNEPVTGFSAVTVTNGSYALQLIRVGPFDPEGRSVNLMPWSGWGAGSYTVRVKEGLMDFAGNTVAAFPDTTFTVPSGFALVNASPPRFAIDVDPSNRPLTATMNRLIDPSALTMIRLRENGVVVPATVSVTGFNGLQVTPAAPLKPSTRYTIDLEGLKSDAGLPVTNPQDWTFTTASTLRATGLAAPLQPLRLR